MYFRDQLERVRNVDGDIVECGVSIGHGTLLFLLLSDFIGVERTYYGFDSFEGFPDPVAKDGVTPITGKRFYANPAETVMKVLRDGRVRANVIDKRVRLVKGYFDQTLPRYDGQIALLHLDCDLYESYKTALATLYDKVASNGVIMFDEYRDSRWPGATTAIDEFFANKAERIVNHPFCPGKYHIVKG
jgi:O-methyltransferase